MGIVSSGKIWPYAISLAILTFFGAIVFSITFIVTKTPVEKSETNMMGYDHADLQANDLIQAEINFKKKYTVVYITDTLSQEKTVIKYKVTDINGLAIDNANIVARITRPDNHANNQELTLSKGINGVYTSETVTLAKPGRWNVMAKVIVSDEQRFYNVHADTRMKEAFEY